MDDLKKIAAYCENHTTRPLPVLLELERETHLKTLAPQMLTGHLQGRLLTLLSHLKQPKSILEIGTFTGYGAICLAQGLQTGGLLHTIEVNPELAHISRKYFAKAGLLEKIQPHTGDAFEIIPRLEGGFDIVYIDAGKQDYARFFELVVKRTNPGGLIIADNVLWSGNVVGQPSDQDARALDAFNKMVTAHPNVESLVLPIRDGILIARKK